MTQVKLCNRCGRPLWEDLCIYCRGFLDGIIKTKQKGLGKYKFIGLIEKSK